MPTTTTAISIDLPVMKCMTLVGELVLEAEVVHSEIVDLTIVGIEGLELHPDTPWDNGTDDAIDVSMWTPEVITKLINEHQPRADMFYWLLDQIDSQSDDGFYPVINDAYHPAPKQMSASTLAAQAKIAASMDGI